MRDYVKSIFTGTVEVTDFEVSYNISIDEQNGTIMVDIENPWMSDSTKKPFKIFLEGDNGELVRLDQSTVKPLINTAEGAHLSKYTVLVENERSTVAKVLKKVGFTVERAETSRVRARPQ